MSVPENMACSENAAYDPASSIVKMSSHAKVACSENISYSNVQQTKADSVRITTTSSTAVYDEIILN